MDEQGAQKIKQLLANGRSLMSQLDVMSAHRDFERWTRDVGKWLDLWGGLSANAHWSALPHSQLVTASGYSDHPVTWQHFHRAVTQRLGWLAEELSRIEAKSKPLIAHTLRQDITRKVFIVHGHDDGAREAVARFLERLGFEAIILHEQANQGRTVIEKINAHGDVSFAVVLLTPDDEGCVKGGTPEPRARQNVLIELGYFLGRLGRDRVCALKRGTVEIPSDFAGVVWEAMDSSNGWKQALGRELQAAGHEIDWNKVMRA